MPESQQEDVKAYSCNLYWYEFAVIVFSVPQFPDGIIFQQDGAPLYFANIVRTFFDEWSLQDESEEDHRTSHGLPNHQT